MAPETSAAVRTPFTEYTRCQNLFDLCIRFQLTENAVEFQKPKNIPICSDRFLNIMVSFFKFYTEFNFTENIISVFEGQEISQCIRSTDDNKLTQSLLRY